MAVAQDNFFTWGDSNTWDNSNGSVDYANWNLSPLGSGGFIVGSDPNLNALGDAYYAFTEIQAGNFIGTYLNSDTGLALNGGSLTLTDGSASSHINGTLSLNFGTLSVAGVLRVDDMAFGDGTLTGSGTVQVSGSATFGTSSFTSLRNSVTLEIQGNATWDQAGVGLDNAGGTVLIDEGANWKFEGVGELGPNSTAVASIDGGSIENAGTVSIQSEVGSGTENLVYLTPDQFTNSGLIVLNGYATGGYFESTSLFSNSGTISVSGQSDTVVLYDSSSQTSNSGTINESGSFNYVDLQSQNNVINSGAIILSGIGNQLSIISLSASGNSQFINSSAGSIQATNGLVELNLDIPGAMNHGSFDLNSSQFQVLGNFANDGSLTLSNSLASINGDLTNSGNGVVNLDSSSTLSVSGQMSIHGGTLNNAGSASTNQLLFDGGALTGPGTLQVSGSATFGSAPNQILTNSGNLVLDGTAAWNQAGTDIENWNGSITIAKGATASFNAVGYLFANGPDGIGEGSGLTGGTLVNSGTLDFTSHLSTLTYAGNWMELEQFANSGDVNVTGTNINVDLFGAQSESNLGTISVMGTGNAVTIGTDYASYLNTGTISYTGGGNFGQIYSVSSNIENAGSILSRGSEDLVQITAAVGFDSLPEGVFINDAIGQVIQTGGNSIDINPNGGSQSETVNYGLIENEDQIGSGGVFDESQMIVNYGIYRNQESSAGWDYPYMELGSHSGAGTIVNFGNFDVNHATLDTNYEGLGTLTNHGLISLANTGSWNDNSVTVTNASDGTIQGSSLYFALIGNAAGTFENDGTIRFNQALLYVTDTFVNKGSASFTGVYNGAYFNGNVLNAASGAITLDQASTLSTGSNPFTGATTNTTSLVNCGTINLDNAYWSDSSGSITNQKSGEINLINGSSAMLFQSSSIGVFRNEGALTLSGPGISDGLSTLDVQGAQFVNSGSIKVLNGATADVHTPVVSNSGSILVDSTSALTIDSGFTQVGAGSSSKIQGSLDLRGSTLTLGTGVTGDGGTLGGGGTINGTVENLSGDVKPGDPQVLTITGDYVQGTNGVLDLSIAGTGGPGATNGYDELEVGGNLTLSGTIDLTFLNNFQPTAGESFHFFTYGGTLSIPSSVTVVDMNNPAETFVLTSSSSGSGGSLTFNTVPEPSGMLPLGILSLPLILGRKRKRSARSARQY